MNRIKIGGMLMFSGTLISFAILFTASLYLPIIENWRGRQIVQGLFIGSPFVLGILLLLLGFIVLVLDLFNED